MFPYFFYIGGMVLIAGFACYLFVSSHEALATRLRGRASGISIGILCVATMSLLPYLGYVQTERSKEVTRRNDEFASIEQSLLKLEFDRLCTYDGHIATGLTPPENQFPCVEGDGMRVVNTPFRSGLLYFVVGNDGRPVRWKGMVDFPVPFTFPNEHHLLSPSFVRKAFFREGATWKDPASRAA